MEHICWSKNFTQEFLLMEIFISRCTRYFEASEIHKSIRSILVTGLINKDLRDIFESTEKVGLKFFEDKMCKAFSRSHMLIWDIERAFNFRRNKEDVDGYEKKIDAIV